MLFSSTCNYADWIWVNNHSQGTVTPWHCDTDYTRGCAHPGYRAYRDWVSRPAGCTPCSAHPTCSWVPRSWTTHRPCHYPLCQTAGKPVHTGALCPVGVGVRFAPHDTLKKSNFNGVHQNFDFFYSFPANCLKLCRYCNDICVLSNRQVVSYSQYTVRGIFHHCHHVKMLSLFQELQWLITGGIYPY